MDVPRIPAAIALPALGVLLLAAFAAALGFGSVAVAPDALFRGFADYAQGAPARSLEATILSLRLPRAVTALAVGGMLGLSGALLQVLLRNPLADPYVLGVSGGASCVALALIALGAGATLIVVGAASGALLALLLLFVLAHRALFARDAGLDPGRDTAILLTGVMIASVCAAAMSLALSLAPDGALRTMVFWLLGDLSGATQPHWALIALACCLAAVALALRDAGALTLMLGGELQAYTQGVPTTQVRRRLIVVTALATGCAVSLAGAVGFVGFVAPHLARLVLGSNQRVVLPAAALSGAILVLLADTVGRTIAAPLQLPVGALTALVGVPVFLWQLQRP